MVSRDKVFVDALYGQSWLEVGGDNIIGVNFANDYGLAWTDAEKAVFANAFGLLVSVCNITFVQTDRASADLVQNKVDSIGMRATNPFIYWSGWHDEPGHIENGIMQSMGFYDITSAAWIGGLAPGTVGNWLINHEIGHAVGLEHPHSTWHGSEVFSGVRPDHPADAGTYGHNDNEFTQMSYRHAKGFSYGPMATDIATLQLMYGANMQTGAGNNSYGLHAVFWNCIWDAGGVDEIYYNGSRDATIDLRQASLLNLPGGGGWPSYIDGMNGGFTIANGAVIEKARGGSGDDRIIGNSYDNILFGNKGDDDIFGGAGNDLLVGGAGRDRLSSGTGSDTMRVGAGDVVVGFTHQDTLDLSWLDPDWCRVVTVAPGKYQLQVDRDSDPSVDLTLTVLGVKPIGNDILL